MHEFIGLFHGIGGAEFQGVFKELKTVEVILMNVARDFFFITQVGKIILHFLTI